MTVEFKTISPKPKQILMQRETPVIYSVPTGLVWAWCPVLRFSNMLNFHHELTRCMLLLSPFY